MRTIVLSSIALSVILVAGTAAAQTPPMQWWPTVSSTSVVSGLSSTAPVRVPITTDPGDSVRKFALAGIRAWEKNNDPCGLEFYAHKLDPAALGFGGAAWTRDAACNAGGILPKKAVLPAGEFVNAIQVCMNGRTGNDAVLKGVRLFGVRFDENGRSQRGAEESFSRPNCKTWDRHIASCGADRVATAVFVHTGPRGVRGLSLECHSVYPLAAEPPKVGAAIGPSGFDAANGGKISVMVNMWNVFGETFTTPPIRVDMRGDGRPGAGRCSGSPADIPRGMVLSPESDINNKQQVRIDFVCSWADIATSTGCESVATPTYIAGQHCRAMLDLTVDGRVSSSIEGEFNRIGNPLP